MSVAVIEYRTKSISPDPPDHHLAWDIEAQIIHGVGVIVSTGKTLLADLRQELEEAGLDLHAASIQEKYHRGRWFPRWREVWIGEEEEQEEEKMKPREDTLLALARRAEQKHPELTTRAMNAAEIIRAGLISINGSPHRFTVQSQAGDDVYYVDTERRSCTCYDWHHQAPHVCGGPMCKHRLACLMLVKLRQVDPGRISQQRQQQEATLAAQRAGALLM